jgi:hypothetical protein
MLSGLASASSGAGSYRPTWQLHVLCSIGWCWVLVLVTWRRWLLTHEVVAQPPVLNLVPMSGLTPWPTWLLAANQRDFGEQKAAWSTRLGLRWLVRK